MVHWLQVYIVPGAVLVSVIMGGGYGTGREIVEYFTQYGALGGLLGLAVSALLFAVVITLTFEVARLERSYDYRSFFQALIGRFWPAFEVLYVLLFLLVLGVIGSASAEILNSRFGLPPLGSTLLILSAVALIVLAGRSAVEQFLSYWCVLMYAVFAAYFVSVYLDKGEAISLAMAQSTIREGWLQAGVLYPMYNVAVVPAMLFATRRISTRPQSLVAGIVAAILVISPAIMFHVSYTSNLDEIMDQSIPNYWMMENMGNQLLTVIFVVAIFGTLIETGVGLIHGLVERIESAFYGDKASRLDRRLRALIALASLGLAGLLSSFGVIALIAQGYGMLAFAFAGVYVLPLCTFGIARILRAGAHSPADTSPTTVGKNGQYDD